MTTLTRRSALAGGVAIAALAAAGPARAQAKPKMRFSSAFTENDLRTDYERNRGGTKKPSKR